METSAVCKNCGNTALESGYELPLCSNCRDTLSRRPLPTWIKLTSAGVAFVLLFAFAKFPVALKAGIALERGRRAEGAKNYSTAVNEYEKVAHRYPGSTLAVARLGIVYYRGGRLPEALATLNRLAGRQTSKELAGEVNSVIREMEAKNK